MMGLNMGHQWGRGHVSGPVFVPDTTPNSFTLTAVAAATVSTTYTAQFTVSGINTASPISLTSPGTYSKNGGAFASADGTVVNGDVIRVRLLSSTDYMTAVNTIVTIGGVSSTFTVTTQTTPDDVTPDAFAFVDVTNAPVSTVISSGWVQLVGTNVPVSISVTGGQFQIADNVSGLNATAASSVATTIAPGKWFRAVHTSSFNSSTATNTVVTVGGVSDTFTSTTAATAPDTTPNAFTFIDITGAELSTVYTSNTITVSGINAATAISVSGLTYSKNGATYTGSAGTVVNGDTVAVRVTSSGSNNTGVSGTLTIGGVSDTYTVTTKVAAEPVTSLFNRTMFDDLLGPIATDAQVGAYTTGITGTDHDGYSQGNGAGWISRRDIHWTRWWNALADDGNPEVTGIDNVSANYYDRAHVGYMKYAMGGYSDDTLLAQANAIAKYYRDWLIGAGGTAAHTQFTRGVALHYAATGDEVSRQLVAHNADSNTEATSWANVGHLWNGGIGGTPGDVDYVGDCRIWARKGESLRLAYQIGATSLAGINYGTKCADWVTKVLNGTGHFVDGSFRSADAQKALFGWTTPSNYADDVLDPSVIYRRPFYIGLLMYELSEQRRVFGDGSSSILHAIRDAAENLWTGTPTESTRPTWADGPDSFGSFNAFYYIEAPSRSGYPGLGIEDVSGDFIAPDLNGLIAASHALLFKEYGAPWQTRFNKVLDGMKQAYIDGGNPKQYMESYSYWGSGAWPNILGL